MPLAATSPQRPGSISLHAKVWCVQQTRCRVSVTLQWGVGARWTAGVPGGVPGRPARDRPHGQPPLWRLLLQDAGRLGAGLPAQGAPSGLLPSGFHGHWSPGRSSFLMRRGAQRGPRCASVIKGLQLHQGSSLWRPPGVMPRVCIHGMRGCRRACTRQRACRAGRGLAGAQRVRRRAARLPGQAAAAGRGRRARCGARGPPRLLVCARRAAALRAGHAQRRASAHPRSFERPVSLSTTDRIVSARLPVYQLRGARP